jgi:oligopeptide/dipeptide ABC transporter ATP-binding protein
MLGIVGESGCGKSATGLSIMRLVPYPGRITAGRVLFRGRDLRSLAESEMRLIRGKSVAMIFQDPLTALNPVLTISRQLTEALTVHERLSPRDARHRAVELLKTVDIPSPEKRINDYPHQFSGGMQERGTSIMFITHALGIVAGLCRKVAVMYAGRIVEQGDTRTLFANPRHPYTHGLLASTPRMDRVERRLQSIGGTAPSLSDAPMHCPFAPRCAYATEHCRREVPPLEAVFARPAVGPGGPSLSGHVAACFRSAEQLW